MLWLRWIGLNAGSAFGASLRAVYAALNTCICAATGGITSSSLDYEIQGKYTMIGLCSGIVAGLVTATPFIWIHSLAAERYLGNRRFRYSQLWHQDQTLDWNRRRSLSVAEHALAGIVGWLFNGFFATNYTISLNGVNTAIQGGFLDKNYKQLYIRFAYVLTCCMYALVVTVVIAKIFCLNSLLDLESDGSS
ncbi:hypothetical protein FRC18_005274 [Serendipita sp. 400]|nr:hypothetical protein FRC18_005274 [Serendipita sp. 400]